MTVGDEGCHSLIGLAYGVGRIEEGYRREEHSFACHSHARNTRLYHNMGGIRPSFDACTLWHSRRGPEIADGNRSH